MTCALLTVGTLVLAYLNWQQMRAPMPGADASGPVSAPHAAVDAPSVSPEADRAGIDPLDWLAPAADAGGFGGAALGALDERHEPLEREPANFAPPRGGQRVWGFARSIGTGREEVAAWRIEGGSLEALAAFYRSQARQRGFEPVWHEPRAPAPGVRSLAYATDDRPMRVLSVRLTQRDDAVHALIALR